MLRLYLQRCKMFSFNAIGSGMCYNFKGSVTFALVTNRSTWRTPIFFADGIEHRGRGDHFMG